MSNEQHIEQIISIRPVKLASATWRRNADPRPEGTFQAFSEGIAREKLEQLRGYADYALPAAPLFSGASQRAPISLSLRQTTEGERILVHQAYRQLPETGEAALYTHMLSGLSAHFAISEAIRLWGSELWYTADKLVKDRQTRLPQLSYSELQKWASFAPSNDLNIWTHLSYLTHAYLLQQYSLENGLKPYLIAIAAPAELIAHLLFWFTHLLPPTLLRTATFSTYEPQISSRLDCRIVGTAAIPSSVQLSSAYNLLYLDTRQRKASALKVLPAELPYKAYAEYVEEILQQSRSHELQELFSEFSQVPEQSVKSFLKYYQATRTQAEARPLARAKPISQPLQLAETPATSQIPNKQSADKERILLLFLKEQDLAHKLNDWELCQRVIELIINDYTWFQTKLAPAMLRRMVDDAEASRGAWDTLEQSLIKRTLEEVARRDERRYNCLFNALRSLTQRRGYERLWNNFFQDLQYEERALASIRSNWQLRKDLLDVALKVLLPEDLEHDLLIASLLSIKPNELVQLLSLLPFEKPGRAAQQTTTFFLPHWSYLLMKQFNETTAPFMPNWHQHDHELIMALVESVLSSHEPDKWQVLQSFFKRLTENKYSSKIELLCYLLKACPDDEIANNLLKRGQFGERDALRFFQECQSHEYLDYYGLSEVRKLYIDFASHQPEIKKLLPRFLRHKDIPVGEIARLLSASRLDSTSKAELFEEEGKVLFSLYPTEKCLLDLGEAYVWNICKETPLVQSRIAGLARTLKDLSSDAFEALSTPLLNALERCIDGAVQLGFLAATLSPIVGATPTNWILFSLALRAHEALLEKRLSQQELERRRRRLAAYLQFALYARDTHDQQASGRAAPDFTVQMLHYLFYGVPNPSSEQAKNSKLLPFIEDQIVAYWPAETRQRWEQIVHQGQSAPASTAPEASPDQAGQSSKPDEELVTDGLQPEEQASLDKERKDMLKRMHELLAPKSKERGIEPIARFWLEHRIALTWNRSRITEEEWQLLVLAYQFHVAFQQVGRPGKRSPACEEALIKLYEENEGLKVQLILTEKEYKRILAAGRYIAKLQTRQKH
ncbi:hypothetical protein EPA93_34410 [Ktedonosporobacter rubrisoli]|uniref:GTPase-associated protein 1 N-terminal domain-containing protein n=1 Tax=Ktedonosporobacter rubrisoli TaxID=2509675 RepID=A0A4P6JYB4_KTERU|nr:hypothetical protein [Ktedonosporobacter rubrisoli]QBD80789.1 hypothetical protein EPA93_34410 [Ktedonosporobacter rubrisoli]